MKFSAEFIDVLKKFSLINPNVYLIPGKVQTTMIGTKGTNSTSFFARAFTDTDIEEAFGIGDLSRFLSALKNFKEPEIKVVEDKFLLIKENSIQIQYTLTNPTFLVYKQEPEKIKPIKGMDFLISKKEIDTIKSFYGVFGSPHIYFQAKVGEVFVGVNNFENPTSDLGTVKLNVPSTGCEDFKAVIPAPMFKVDSADYKLSISRKGLVYLGNDKTEYYVPIEKKFSEL